MCRLMAYLGDPILLAHVVLWPDRSIIKQSYDARERLSDPGLPFHLQFGNLNGDGFGIGWFSERTDLESKEGPCVFTGITPAWNNDNLARLCSKIVSPLVFAHVRAAYPGIPVSEQNCHPFHWRRYMWMHNGVIGGFYKMRRQILSRMSDVAYDAITSFHSDSAIAFAIFIDCLPHHDRQLSPDILRKAMEKTIATIVDISKKNNLTDVSLLNFVVSDGSTIVGTRFVYPSTASPATMYYAEGNAFARVASAKNNPLSPSFCSQSSLTGEGKYELTYAETGSGAVLLTSEPITGTSSDWVSLPKNYAVIISREKSGYVNIMRSPLNTDGIPSRHDEVSLCLEAVSSGIHTTSRTWSAKQSIDPIADNQLEIVEQEDDRISGEASSVLCIVADHSRNRLLASMTNGWIKVWSLDSQKTIRRWMAHSEPITEILISGDLLYTAGGPRLRVWDLDTFECTYVAQMTISAGTLRAIAVWDNSVYVGGQDASVKLFALDRMRFSPENLSSEEMECCKRTASEAEHLSVINCMEICGKYICSAGGDAVIRVWDVESLSLVSVLKGHRGSVLACKSYSQVLFTGGRDNTIRVWDLEAMLCRRSLIGHKDDILNIDLLCGEEGCAGSRGFRRRSWSIGTGAGMCLVASASADCTVRVWSMGSWACLRIFNLLRVEEPLSDPSGGRRKEAVKEVTPLSVALTKSRLYVGTTGGDIFIWEISDIVTMAKHRELPRSPSICPDKVGCAVGLEKGDSSVDSRSMDGCLIADSPCAGNLIEFERKTKAVIEMELERRLADFISLKSISNDPVKKEDCFKAAKFVAKEMESLGAEVKLIQSQEDKNPVVIGRLGQDKGKPTVTFYGHYDVQPADEAGWKTDPFKLHSRDGYLYGRGASDNKGPILAFVYSVKELLETRAYCDESPLPINIAFLLEGEEENGSKGTVEAIQQNTHWFRKNLLTIISNTQWVGENIPCLTYGMRGMISLDIMVSGPKGDLHSGNDGGVCDEPMVDLIKVLSTLVDNRSEICVPGFYDDVASNLLDDAWTGLETSEEFSPEIYQEALGIPGLAVPSSKRDILQARWCMPTLSVVDMRTDVSQVEVQGKCMRHYRFGPTRFSVIPAIAVGKISIRFVPKQSKQKMIDLLRNHVEHEFAKLRSKNSISVEVLTSGDWWEASTESKYFWMAKNAISKAWGKEPLTVREGGTMPLASSLESVLGAGALLIPMGQASDNCHLANERIRRVNLMKGKDAIKYLLQEIIADVSERDGKSVTQ